MTTIDRRLLVRAAALAAAVLLVPVLGAPVFAQEEPADQTAGGEEMIRQIEKEGEAVMTGRHFAYDPAGRRDPFEPLVKSQPLDSQAKRPRGIAGMMVSEIALKGVAIDPRGSAVALFQGSDNRGYTLRVGDIVYDGKVISIDPDRGNVVFRQQVDDPRRIKPYRDVIKRLNPTDGAGPAVSDEEEGA